MITLALGIVLAISALFFVLYPLFRDQRAPHAPGDEMDAAGVGPAELENSAVAALREIEFDKATGKLSEHDYAVLKARYTQEAVVEMRAATAPGDVTSDDVEQLISRYRAKISTCPACGPRPEPDAVYCSSCGRYLREKCARCGSDVGESGARFCSSCGSVLAA